MPIQMCPIDIPEGWEFVRYGVPSGDDTFLNEDGEPDSSKAGCVAPWVIIRPALQVGDWVRVDNGYPVDGGKVGEVIDTRLADRCHVRAADGRSFWVERDRLTKQTRTIEPYDIDQCIQASSRIKTRHVRAGRCETVIESFHIAGVTVANQDMSFVSYVEAARSLVWRGGEAFGVERWEDAK